MLRAARFVAGSPQERRFVWIDDSHVDEVMVAYFAMYSASNNPN
jgi:hypothetical protein